MLSKTDSHAFPVRMQNEASALENNKAKILLPCHLMRASVITPERRMLTQELVHEYLFKFEFLKPSNSKVLKEMNKETRCGKPYRKIALRSTKSPAAHRQLRAAMWMLGSKPGPLEE